MDINGTTTSTKRQRDESSRETKSYPRKRALKACKTCRFRKTKCDNARPICGFCRSLSAVCVYDDACDLSTLDHASQLIIDRLDQVLQKLDEPKSSDFAGRERDRRDAAPRATSPGAPSVVQAEEDELNMDENSPIPEHRTSPDAIIDWPIFGNRYPLGYFTNALFAEDFTGKCSSNFPRAKGSLVINEEEVPKLVEHFICRVHTKCPVLDVQTARRYAAEVAQDGLRWDGPSCLTLIMCALGCVAKPFMNPSSKTTILEGTSTSLDRDSLEKGRLYFEAACKRIGLLNTSILSTQCIYLCGIFEMYNLNPLKGWKWFSNSSSTLYSYLRCQEVCTRGDPSIGSAMQRMEASMYWASYKSMCELRTELPLPASILAEFKYPYLLPTPPPNLDSGSSPTTEASPALEGTRVGYSTLQDLGVASDTLQQQAWFFFLTDLILSRVSARVLMNLYDTEHHGWDDKHIGRMLRAADEFERHLEDWFKNLPPLLQLEHDDIHLNDELRFAVQILALEVKTWLYRPFLYYAIHHVPHPSFSHRLQTLVSKAMETCFEWIQLPSLRYRDHRSWYLCRSVLSSALSILAAVKGGMCSELGEIGYWKTDVMKAIQVMKFWEEESPDLQKGREVLEALCTEIEPDGFDHF